MEAIYGMVIILASVAVGLTVEKIAPKAHPSVYWVIGMLGGFYTGLVMFAK